MKSGSDFQYASIVTLNLSKHKRLEGVHIEQITLDSRVLEDCDMKLIVSSYLGNDLHLSKFICL